MRYRIQRCTSIDRSQFEQWPRYPDATFELNTLIKAASNCWITSPTIVRPSKPSGFHPTIESYLTEILSSRWRRLVWPSRHPRQNREYIWTELNYCMPICASQFKVLFKNCDKLCFHNLNYDRNHDLPNLVLHCLVLGQTAAPGSFQSLETCYSVAITKNTTWLYSNWTLLFALR